MIDTIRRIESPSRPRKPRIPGNLPVVGLPEKKPEVGKPLTDEWGLLLSVFGELPPRSRQYIALAYDYMHLDKHVAPTHQGAGTMPEMVFFGGLLARGFTYRQGESNTFEFQTDLLGGRRIPGGTVADFTVFHDGGIVAVYVQSVFHAAGFVWAGRATVEQERNLYLQVAAQRGVRAVVEVNQVWQGFPLENGPDDLVDNDFRRVLAA